MTTPDLRLTWKSDGLYRHCIVCGHEFKIKSAAEILRETKAGRVAEIGHGERYPRNLLQLDCGHCPPQGGTDHSVETTSGPHDPRWQLRRDGLESWRDYSG